MELIFYIAFFMITFGGILFTFPSFFVVDSTDFLKVRIIGTIIFIIGLIIGFSVANYYEPRY